MNVALESLPAEKRGRTRRPGIRLRATRGRGEERMGASQKSGRSKACVCTRNSCSDEKHTDVPFRRF